MTLYSVDECIRLARFYLEKVEMAAQLQGVTEGQYEKLVQIARAGIVLVMQLQAGDVVPENWIVERDILVKAASSLVDVSQKQEQEV